MLNIHPVCSAGGGTYVAVQPVVLNLRWDLVAAISDLRVVRSVVPIGSAHHPPCQASGQPGWSIPKKHHHTFWCFEGLEFRQNMTKPQVEDTHVCLNVRNNNALGSN